MGNVCRWIFINWVLLLAGCAVKTTTYEASVNAPIEDGISGIPVYFENNMPHDSCWIYKIKYKTIIIKCVDSL